jgi:hypothetical protein
MGAWYASATGHGGYWEDISGQNNHGTLTGMDPATDWVEGKDGWGLDFDGINDYVVCPTANITPTHDLSVVLLAKWAAWYPASAANSRFVFSNINGNDVLQLMGGSNTQKTPRKFSFAINLGGTQYGYYTTGAGAKADDFALSTWYAVVASWNCTSHAIHIYVDGADLALTAGTGYGLGTADGKLYIAQRSDLGAPSAMTASSVTLYQRELSLSDVQRLQAEPHAHIWVPGRRSTWWFSAAAAASSIPAIQRYYRNRRQS